MPFELAIDSNYWISSMASSWDVGKLDFFLFLVYKVFQKNLSLTANRTLKISRYGLLNKYISLQWVIYSFGDLGITLNYLKLIFIYNLPISKTTFFLYYFYCGFLWVPFLLLLLFPSHLQIYYINVRYGVKGKNTKIIISYNFEINIYLLLIILT